MGALIAQEDLLVRLEQGDLVLLPSSRAARALRRDFDARQQRRGLKAWQAPRVLAWAEWTGSLWTQLITSGAESRLLLNAAQEHSLWLQVIGDFSSGAFSQETRDSLAGLARSAWRLCGAWEIRHRLRGTAVTHDTRTFSEWAEAFEHQCTESGYLSPSFLEQALVSHIEKDHLELPAQLRLLNFPEFTRAQARLLSALRKRVNLVKDTSTHASHFGAARSGSRHLAVAASERHELLLAARWARSEVLARSCHDSQISPVRVGLLLPEKGVDLAELESVFREVLAPELQPVGADLSCTPWEIAAGEPLGSVPLVAAAMDLLRWCTGPLPISSVSALLTSPYLGQTAEREANARFDVEWLRRKTRLRPEISLREAALMSVAAERRFGADVPPAGWLSFFHELSSKADPKLRRSFSEWMEVVRQLLRAASWPGDRRLSTREEAAVRAWEDALDQTATLDFAGERVLFAAAVKAIERQAGTISFTVQGGDAPVVALNLNEATGLRWDALVVLRGTELSWPPGPRPHPFLAASLQREHRMPGTYPEREAALFQSVLAQSSTVFATCAAENVDGPLRPSPFLTQLGFEPVPAETLLPSPPPQLPVSQEVMPDQTALPALPSAEVRGGARVLQLQAACGFLAFAAVRLGASELEAREAGFDARESGTLLHRSLENFWNRVRSQDALRALTTEQRNHVLAESIDAAVSVHLQVESSWDTTYLALQKQRLGALLSAWLERELKRSPFTVADSEHESLIPVGPLTLHVRVDRVDQVEGGVVLVDYKSGYAAEPKAWLGERPDQPQLPLYSLLHTPEEVKAVTFAHVRAGTKMGWNGFETQARVLPRASTVGKLSLAEHLVAWRSTLTQLATDFSAGKTEANPKDFTANCKRCAHRLLCRLDPASLHSDQISEEEQTVEEAYG